MFCCWKESAVAVTAAAAAPLPLPERHREWRGAGLVFLDRAAGLILGGYEPGKRVPAIYGIGGKRDHDDDTVYTTAFREAFEELLAVQLTAAQRARLIGLRRAQWIEEHGGYIMIHYTFADLTAFLQALSRAGVRSPLYGGACPTTVADLVLKREYRASTEMQQLCLLPLVSPGPTISADLRGDIQRIVAATATTKIPSDGRENGSRVIHASASAAPAAGGGR